MKIIIAKDAEEMGAQAAALAAEKLNSAIAEKGQARLIFSTGESQFTVIRHLVKKDLPWNKIVVFHLDEYVGPGETHNASFRKYLKERIVDLVSPKKMVYVSGEGDIEANIKLLTKEIREAPVDLAFIGIGENAHIAFNDPPADFASSEAYIVVNLDDACKKQQVGEGWFEKIPDVPNQAISMTVHQIMLSDMIISCVPGKRKAQAVRDTLSSPAPTNMIPATMLKLHKNWHLFLDEDSASLIGQEK